MARKYQYHISHSKQYMCCSSNTTSISFNFAISSESLSVFCLIRLIWKHCWQSNCLISLSTVAGMWNISYFVHYFSVAVHARECGGQVETGETLNWSPFMWVYGMCSAFSGKPLLKSSRSVFNMKYHYTVVNSCKCLLMYFTHCCVGVLPQRVLLNHIKSYHVSGHVGWYRPTTN